MAYNKIYDITNLIFYVVGHVSNIVLIIQNTCYNDNKTQTIKINRYFVNDNQDIITSTIRKYAEHVQVHKLNTCMLYGREYGNLESTYLDYEFELSPELVISNITQYIMEIEDQTIRNYDSIQCTYIYIYRDIYIYSKLRGCLISYDITHQTIMFSLDSDSRNSSPTRNNE